MPSPFELQEPRSAGALLPAPPIPMDKVAIAAKVSKARVYSHFQDKENLFMIVQEMLHGRDILPMDRDRLIDTLVELVVLADSPERSR